MVALSLKHISKSFSSSQPVLRDISLEVEDGELFFILGPSGCGKSTALRIIAGLERADTGSVIVDGRSLDAVPPNERGIGMVFQNYALWPHMTVRQNVSFGLEVQGLTANERDERIDEVLSLVRLTGLEERYPHQISGGQQQRVALARALAIRPLMLLLDEPLSNLDARLRDEIRHELAELHSRLKITTIYVTHDQEDALTLASRIAIFNAGRIEQIGTPREVYERPSSRFVAGFMGDANILSPTSLTGLNLSDKQLLCVRPEVIALVSSDDPTSYASGKITDIVYRGAMTEILVKLADGTALMIHQLGRTGSDQIAHGDTVGITWSKDATMTIDPAT
jgi:ABC-type Fe3+/spermidine/putrescine transport system ATPase subunit